jgi:hypothetical protein
LREGSEGNFAGAIRALRMPLPPIELVIEVKQLALLIGAAVLEVAAVAFSLC